MKTTHCDYCGNYTDDRLVKEVRPPEWEDGGMACAVCRNELDEIAELHEADRIDAARWRALRPLLYVECRWGETWVRSRRILTELNTVDEIVDKLVQIAEGKQ